MWDWSREFGKGWGNIGWVQNEGVGGNMGGWMKGPGAKPEPGSPNILHILKMGQPRALDRMFLER